MALRNPKGHPSWCAAFCLLLNARLVFGCKKHADHFPCMSSNLEYVIGWIEEFYSQFYHVICARAFRCICTHTHSNM